MKRIHFDAAGLVSNVSLIAIGTDGEAGTIDVDDAVFVGPGMIRAGDGFTLPATPIGAADVDAALERAFLAGFAPPIPAFAGERLQVRDMDDRTNWLTSQAAYTAAVAGGFGDVVDADFRCASNRIVTVTYAEGLTVLLAMAAWGKAIMRRSWTLKDALERGEAITAADLTTGWPE